MRHTSQKDQIPEKRKVNLHIFGSVFRSKWPTIQDREPEFSCLTPCLLEAVSTVRFSNLFWEDFTDPDTILKIR